MRYQQIGSGLHHFTRLLFIEYVRTGEQAELVRPGDHLDFRGETHTGFFQVQTEYSIDEANGRKILNPREPCLTQLTQKDIHQPERGGTADAGEHRRMPHNRQDLTRHVQDDCIGTASRHPEPPGIVNDDQICAARLGALGREARARAGSDEKMAARDGGYKLGLPIWFIFLHNTPFAEAPSGRLPSPSGPNGERIDSYWDESFH